MNNPSSQAPQPESSSPRRPRSKRLLSLVVGVIVLYLLVAYIVVPLAWKRYIHRHPTFDDVPGITHTADGIPGDPLNVALIGTETEVTAIMLAAKWYPADPLGLRSDLKIAADTVLKRADVR